MNGRNKLYNYLKDSIDRGRLTQGEKLESTTFYAEKFKISVPTAHAALRDLVKSGYLFRQLGKGTFVAKEGLPLLQARRTVCIITSEENDFQKATTLNLLVRLNSLHLESHIVYAKENKFKFAELADLFVKIKPIAVVVKSYCSQKMMVLRDNFKQIPFIFINDFFDNNFAGTMIYPNTYQAAYRAVKYLFELGHKEIAYFQIYWTKSGAETGEVESNAVMGYRHALADFSLTYRKEAFCLPGKHVDNSIKTILASQPTALFCLHDHRAAEIADFIKSKNLKVPDDISLISAWNTSWAEAYGLSSFELHFEQVIDACAERISSLLQKKSAIGRCAKILIEPELIIRKSCKEVSRAAKRTKCCCPGMEL